LVQTHYPEDWAVTLAASHDFGEFYRKELEQRSELGYPPFNHLILVIFSGRTLKTVTDTARKFAGMLGRKAKAEKRKDIQILGPAPAPLSRIKNQYRWQLLIKTKDVVTTSGLINRILKEEKDAKRKTAVRTVVDVDPMNML
jgi:primosomal protein N' (replication factor Y)